MAKKKIIVEVKTSREHLHMMVSKNTIKWLVSGVSILLASTGVILFKSNIQLIL